MFHALIVIDFLWTGYPLQCAINKRHSWREDRNVPQQSNRNYPRRIDAHSRWRERHQDGCPNLAGWRWKNAKGNSGRKTLFSLLNIIA